MEDFLVNVFPILSYVPAWFPWTNWKETARGFRKQKNDIMDGTFEWTKAQIVSVTVDTV